MKIHVKRLLTALALIFIPGSGIILGICLIKRLWKKRKRQQTKHPDKPMIQRGISNPTPYYNMNVKGVWQRIGSRCHLKFTVTNPHILCNNPMVVKFSEVLPEGLIPAQDYSLCITYMSANSVDISIPIKGWDSKVVSIK